MSVESLLSTIDVKLALNQLARPINESNDLIHTNDKTLVESYLTFDRSISEGRVIDAIVAADTLVESSNVDAVGYISGFSDVLRSAILTGYNSREHLIESLKTPGHAFYANNYLKESKIVTKPGMYIVTEANDNTVTIGMLNDHNITSKFDINDAADLWESFSYDDISLMEDTDGGEHTAHTKGRPDLRKARVEAGMSQADFAAAMGIGESTLAKWELGFANPQHEMVQKAADAMNVNPEDFFDSGTVNAYEGNINQAPEEAEKPEENRPVNEDVNSILELV